ncbi:hypothetical protein T07_7455 [Trichinella nelsoni]|uniref:Uncharacterized protein n=1 Tax=Trichinella nelsoni TaxID=6336 RepID=A0A0V0RM49_9BILA|nr:hypothetical protein T07_7455 [Trichinella nelsoni]
MWVALKFNDNDYYPIVSLHLRIFTINAIASTSAERSFTAVKYLRSYFRTTMAEERQNGIALVNCALTARDFTRQGNQSCGILNIS